MNFLKNIFGNEKQTEDTPKIWNTLDKESQLDDIIEKSHQQPVAIFKHSTRCSISFMAKDRIERSWDIPGEEVALYYLDLITFRPVSNLVAERLGVQHESPQIILIKMVKLFTILHTVIFLPAR